MATQTHGKGALTADEKLAAAALAEQANKQVLAERETARAEFIRRVEAHGEYAAIGKASLLDTALDFGRACDPTRNDRVMQADDAAIVYAAYVRGHNAASGQKVEVEKDGSNVSVSILKSFGLPNVARYGDTMWNQVLEVRSTIGREDRKHNSAYNAIVTVNRAFDKAAQTGYDAAVEACTDEWVRALLTKPDTAGKSDAEKAAKLLEQLLKLANGEALLQSGLTAKLADADKLVASLVAGSKGKTLN